MQQSFIVLGTDHQQQGSSKRSGSFLGRLRSSFSDQEQNQGEEEQDERDEPPPYGDDPPVPQPKKRTVFIRAVELTLNGAPLDMV